jgi:hypothetical protein
MHDGLHGQPVGPVLGRLSDLVDDADSDDLEDDSFDAYINVDTLLADL